MTPPPSSALDRPRLIALIVSSAMFMAQLDSTIVVTALPRMAQVFGQPPVQLSIGITIYILVQAVILPASSWISDRLGARRVFGGAMIVFTCASALCGLCHTLPQFVGARVLQGVGAALMTPVGRVVMLRSVKKSDLISTMAIATVPMLVAPTLGPPLGGLITTYLDWPWVFLLNVPLGIVGVFLILRFIPEIRVEERRPFDVVGFLLVGSGLSLFLYGLDRIGGAADWRWPAAWLALGAFVCGLAVRHAQRHHSPLIGLTSLRYPTLRMNILGGGALSRLPVRAAPFVLPLMFQTGMGKTAFQSGFLLMFMSAGDLALKSITTQTLRRFGFRNVLAVTSVGTAACVALCCLFTRTTPLLIIVLILTLGGMFRSLLFSGMGNLTFADVPQAEMSSASVLWNMTQQITNAAGISIAALAMHMSATWRGGGDNFAIVDGRWALGVSALIGLGATLSILRLPPDAGAEVSGHQPKRSLNAHS